MPPRIADPRVAILLSTYQGEAYLREQLDSLLAQTYTNWTLYWRDDRSTDATRAILAEFGARAGQGRCVEIAGPATRLGPTASFLTLLRSVSGSLDDGDMVAFADQDDVWLPHKLARGAAALGGGDDVPVLYCARQVLVDSDLRKIGYSGGIARRASFPASLTQNVATGCTVMMNGAAARLVAGSEASTGTLHDWWSYLLVTANGGRVVQDSEPVILYRQHARNLVGAPASLTRRAWRALRRGPGVFMGVLRQHVAALSAQPQLLSAPAREELAHIRRALEGGPIARIGVLRMAGFQRQTWPETLLFRCWFLLG